MSDVPMEERIAIRRERWHRRQDRAHRRRTWRKLLLWTVGIVVLAGIAWFSARIGNQFIAGGSSRIVPRAINNNAPR